jgi:molybdopterin-guanine dinucleotide biosynthesis protein A
MRIAGLILAGGAGSRLGGVDKARIRLGGQTLLDRVFERLSPQVDLLAISAPAAAGRPGVPVVPDAASERLGPLAGVAAGLAWAAQTGADHLVTAAVDTPFLPCDLVPRLVRAGEETSGLALAASPSGLHPTFGLWPVARAAEVAALLAGGERQLRRAAEGAGIAWFAEDEAFFNINTPDDLVRAEAMLG